MFFANFVAVLGRCRLENDTSVAKYRQKCPKIADFWPENDHFWVIFELFWAKNLKIRKMRGRYAVTLAIKQPFTHINEKTRKSSGYIFNFTKPQKDQK